MPLPLRVTGLDMACPATSAPDGASVHIQIGGEQDGSVRRNGGDGGIVGQRDKLVRGGFHHHHVRILERSAHHGDMAANVFGDRVVSHGGVVGQAHQNAKARLGGGNGNFTRMTKGGKLAFSRGNGSGLKRSRKVGGDFAQITGMDGRGSRGERNAYDNK